MVLSEIPLSLLKLNSLGLYTLGVMLVIFVLLGVSVNHASLPRAHATALRGASRGDQGVGQFEEATSVVTLARGPGTLQRVDEVAMIGVGGLSCRGPPLPLCRSVRGRPRACAAPRRAGTGAAAQAEGAEHTPPRLPPLPEGSGCRRVEVPVLPAAVQDLTTAFARMMGVLTRSAWQWSTARTSISSAVGSISKYCEITFTRSFRKLSRVRGETPARSWTSTTWRRFLAIARLLPFSPLRFQNLLIRSSNTVA